MTRPAAVKKYDAPRVVCTLPVYYGSTAYWCDETNPLANKCCPSCHEEANEGYALGFVMVGHVDVEMCCVYDNA